MKGQDEKERTTKDDRKEGTKMMIMGLERSRIFERIIKNRVNKHQGSRIEMKERKLCRLRGEKIDNSY